MAPRGAAGDRLMAAGVGWQALTLQLEHRYTEIHTALVSEGWLVPGRLAHACRGAETFADLIRDMCPGASDEAVLEAEDLCEQLWSAEAVAAPSARRRLEASDCAVRALRRRAGEVARRFERVLPPEVLEVPSKGTLALSRWPSRFKAAACLLYTSPSPRDA